MEAVQALKDRVFVGIGEIAISDDPDARLVAANLGSCLGVVAYDPKAKIGGLVHCLLPLSANDKEKAKDKPCLFVDTGVAFLLREIIARGASKNDQIIAVAGGSQINDERGVFEIGKRNHTVLRKILWKNNLLIKGEDIGGTHSRTVTLSIGSGEIKVKGDGKKISW